MQNFVLFLFWTSLDFCWPQTQVYQVPCDLKFYRHLAYFHPPHLHLQICWRCILSDHPGHWKRCGIISSQNQLLLYSTCCWLPAGCWTIHYCPLSLVIQLIFSLFKAIHPACTFLNHRTCFAIRCQKLYSRYFTTTAFHWSMYSGWWDSARKRSQIGLRQQRRNYWYQPSWTNDKCFQRAVKVSLHNHIQCVLTQCDTRCLDLGSWLCTWPSSLALVPAAWLPTQTWDSWGQGAGRGNTSLSTLDCRDATHFENLCQSWEWAVGSHLGLSTPTISSSKISLKRLFWPCVNRDRVSSLRGVN